MIIYSYKISDITNNVQILSLFRSNSIIDKGEQPVIDDFPLNPEDVSMIKKYLAIGSSLVAYSLSGYAKNLIDSDGVTILEPFEFDIEYSNDTGMIVFRTNMPDNWPISTKTLIDESIKDCLENYVLYRVSKHKMIELNSYYEDFNYALSNVRGYISRRNTIIKRKYNLF